ncbi:alternate-type signal peptide domain-containing protein [Glaciihabitans sp. dw_435]|uniref:alternate-type signal peptide domain-containing protein n=1 Tax=Glaciihabitans sp. dw_435 TaxID=2720081 RepID=UPI001BD5D1EE|nr:alternate-type signal peptide domain-containing protein [Glaciihabitans sp. dw_435]
MKTVTKAAIAGAAGFALLLGGAGTLAYWTDAATGADVQIQTGNLAIGTIADTGWTLIQAGANVSPAQTVGVAYTNQLLVPGDQLRKTINVPVVLTGANIKATLSVAGTASPSSPVAGLTTAVVSVGGTAGTIKTLTASDPAVPVVFAIEIPYGTAAYNTNKSLPTTTFSTQYTLTQIPVATP